MGRAEIRRNLKLATRKPNSRHYRKPHAHYCTVIKSYNKARKTEEYERLIRIQSESD